MRPLKAIFFAVFIVLASQAAWSQSHDLAVADRSESVKLVKAFPNPAIDFFSLKFEQPIAKEVKVTVHNIIGNVVEVETEVLDEYEIRLRVKELPVGVYLLAIKDTDNYQNAIKFLKR
jgi:hypothetical protein